MQRESLYQYTFVVVIMALPPFFVGEPLLLPVPATATHVPISAVQVTQGPELQLPPPAETYEASQICILTVIASAAGTAGTIGAGVEVGATDDDGVEDSVGGRIQPLMHWYEPAHALAPALEAALQATKPCVHTVGTEDVVPRESLRTMLAEVQSELLAAEYTETPND